MPLPLSLLEVSPLPSYCTPAKSTVCTRRRWGRSGGREPSGGAVCIAERILSLARLLLLSPARVKHGRNGDALAFPILPHPHTQTKPKSKRRRGKTHVDPDSLVCGAAAALLSGCWTASEARALLLLALPCCPSLQKTAGQNLAAHTRPHVPHKRAWTSASLRAVCSH